MAFKEEKSATLVGVFLFIGLVCLGLMVAQFSNIAGRFNGDYELSVIFPDASGVVRDSSVTYGGAKVGRVISRPEMQPDNTIVVRVAINGDLKIPEGSEFSISSVSLLGDKSIAIKPTNNASLGEFYQDGDTIDGVTGTGFDALAAEAQNVAVNANDAILDFRKMAAKLDHSVDGFDEMVTELNAALKSINSSVLTKENTDAIKTTLENIQESSNVIRDTSEKLKPILTQAEPFFDEAKATIATVKKATLTAEETFMKASEKIDSLEPAFAELPETLKNLREASNKATAMMEKVEEIASDTKEVVARVKSGKGLLNTLTDDEALKEDTKSFVKNLKEYGVLRYRDAPTEKKQDPKRTRFRGERR